MGGITGTLSAGAVAGSTLVLLGMVLVAMWLSGWYEERARRAEGAVRRGARLRRGFGAVHGTARPVDGRPGGLLVTTTVSQVRFGGSAWREVGHATTGTPFAVVLDSGEEVEVDPRDAVVQDDPTDIQGQSFNRDVVSRVSTGDAIWVTGLLTPRRAQGAGAYRTGVGRARITKPRRGPITISRTSPVPRWRNLAAAHKTGAYLAVGLCALVHGLVFRQVDLAILLRNQVDCDQRLADPRWLPMTLLGALVAVSIAALGWRARVVQAREAVRRD